MSDVRYDLVTPGDSKVSVMSHSDAFYEAAIYYNKKNGVQLPDFTDHQPDTRGYADVVAVFQTAHELKVDGKCGAMTATAFRQELMDGGEVRLVTYDDLVEIAMIVSEFEGDYWSLNRDGEFRGLFDRPPKKWHKFSDNNPDTEHGVHVGLSFGFIQFTQDGGKLGVLLNKMFTLAPVLFRDTFGAHYEALLKTTQAKGKTRKFSQYGEDGMRSKRVQPVGGHDLWEGSYWPDRFKKAGREKLFQRAQLELAVDDYMMPAIRLCEKYGLKSERSLAIAFDRCVQYGPGGADKHLFSKVPRRSGEGEHLWLKRFEDKWEGKHWHHRTENLWRESRFWDGPCDWTGLE